MYEKDKRSFFEKLTGTINIEDEETPNKYNDEEQEEQEQEDSQNTTSGNTSINKLEVHDEEQNSDVGGEEGELAVDVYENKDEIFVQAMIAGVEPEDVDVSITREEVIIKGNRENMSDISDDNYYHKELYWGKFSRKILLPEEIDPEKSEAIEKHGLLILRLSKLNKKKSQKLEVKAL